LAPTTELVFRDDPYQQSCLARVVGGAGNAVLLDRTVFYPTGGGQPGDRGFLRLGSGAAIEIIDSRKAPEGEGVLHILRDGSTGPEPGTPVSAELDWERRHRLMRTHSCLHLLCRAIDGAVTGGQVGELRGRLDFDIPDPTLDKEAIAARINEWIAADRPIRSFWIEEAELERRPDLVRTMSVRPPANAGRIRLVEIEGIDLQACGGTHVRSTAEIGPVQIAKIEKKGRQNRRVVVELG
jgi:misacylated tRNA(Ala) deacylase